MQLFLQLDLGNLPERFPEWGHKHSLALGVRLVRKGPLRRVHECVFGVLALESEPVDSRL